MRFSNLSIRWQLAAVSAALVCVPAIVLGALSYRSAARATHDQVAADIAQRANEIVLFLDAVKREIASQHEAADEIAGRMVRAQAEALQEMVRHHPGTDADLAETIGKIDVGKSGYVWIANDEGTLLHTRSKQLVGKRLIDMPDAEGNSVFPALFEKAKHLGPDEVGEVVYPWRNPGETEAREKIVGFFSLPERHWVLGVGAYTDEIADLGFAARRLEALKSDLAAMLVGKTGYVYVLDAEGHYVVSAGRKRDGERIWEAKDASGNLFIQRIIHEADAMGPRKVGLTRYPWQNKGEAAPRMKIVAFTKYDTWGWYIGVGAYEDEFLDGLVRIRHAVLAVMGTAVPIGVAFAFWFATSWTRLFRTLARHLQRVADGDLAPLDGTTLPGGRNELGQMSCALAGMLEGLRTLVGSVRSNVDSQFNAITGLSASAEEVSTSMSQVSQAVADMSRSAHTVAEASEQCQRVSARTQEHAATGSSAAEAARRQMQVISDTTKRSGERIATLQTKSNEVGSIVNTISAISHQTNLLALNASIEAARAGEAGRGFAVVAGEVRGLAEASSRASAQIAELIAGIQHEVGNAIEVIGTNCTHVAEGERAVHEALIAFEAIPALVAEVDQALGQMKGLTFTNASGAEEVSASTGEVARAMDEVNRTSQQLSLGADSLRSLVSRFNLDDASHAPLAAAIAARPESSGASASLPPSAGAHWGHGQRASSHAHASLATLALAFLAVAGAAHAEGTAAGAPPPTPEACPAPPPATPGGFQVPGTSTVLTLGGYVKLDMLWSSQSVGGAGGSNTGDQFLLPGTIPVDPPKGESGEITFHPRQSRLFMRSDTPTDWGKVTTYAEVDFYAFQAPGDERVGNGYSPQIRHAYGRVGPLLAGQTWSTFMTPCNLPDVNDFVGPVAATFVRQPQMRWTQPLGPVSVDVAVESPETTLRDPDGKRQTPDDDRLPDFVLRVGTSGAWGEVAMAGLLRELRSSGTVVAGVEDTAIAGGFNIAGKVATWGKDDVRFSLEWGQGIGRYVGLNVFDDASVDVAGHIAAIPVYGGFAAYRHVWTETLRSSLVYGYLTADPDPGSVPASTSREVQSVHVNLLWNPVTPFTIGPEYIWASRQLESHASGHLDRFELSARFAF